MNDDEAGLGPQPSIRSRLGELKLQHQDLDDSISALESLPQVDQIQIARLKKRKLALRDEISALDDQITPDIIA
jgi:hypothetical protein